MLQSYVTTGMLGAQVPLNQTDNMYVVALFRQNYKRLDLKHLLLRFSVTSILIVEMYHFSNTDE